MLRVGSEGKLLDSISPEAIDELRRRAKILEVVSDHVTMKQSGSTYFGRCPFQSEQSPSFSVVPDEGFFHCFGCHEKGDVLSFVAKFQKIDIRASVEYLLNKYGIDPNLGAID